MNIFMLEKSPNLAAQYHSDIHVNKMILESAQMLSTCHHVFDEESVTPNLYKKTHMNHPCNKWIRESSVNYMWTFELFKSLCEEYTFRRDKIHSTSRLLPLLEKLPKNNKFIDTKLTEPPQAMPDIYKSEDVVHSYRTYYIHEKNYFMSRGKKVYVKYTKRNRPDWFISLD